MKKLIKPLDIILIAVILLGGAGFFAFKKHSTRGATAVITIGGEEYKKIDLEAVEVGCELSLPCEPPAVLLVEKGAVSFARAECKDKICVHSGKLSKRGDTAACLPARVVVSIQNGSKSEIDALVY